LERKRFRSLSTGRVIDCDRKSDCDWREFSFPTRWHYDVLWGLDNFFGNPESVPIHEWPNPLNWQLGSKPGMVDGRSIIPTLARSTSKWKARGERRAVGTRCVHCAFWIGIARKADAPCARRPWRRRRVGRPEKQRQFSFAAQWTAHMQITVGNCVRRKHG